MSESFSSVPEGNEGMAVWQGEGGPVVKRVVSHHLHELSFVPFRTESFHFKNP